MVMFGSQCFSQKISIVFSINSDQGNNFSFIVLMVGMMHTKIKNQLSKPSKNSCSRRDSIVGRSSLSGCRQLLMKLFAASDRDPGLAFAFLQMRSAVGGSSKQERCSCFRLSIICSASWLSWVELQGCNGERTSPVAVIIRMARHPNPHTSFFSDFENPLERRNSGAKQCSSQVSNSSLGGTKEVALTALMNSYPFLLQRIVVGLMRLCARRQQCMCCSPTAICLRYLLASASSKGPNSSSKVLRLQFLNQSESTYLFPSKETSAQMGRMLG